MSALKMRAQYTFARHRAAEETLSSLTRAILNLGFAGRSSAMAALVRLAGESPSACDSLIVAFPSCAEADRKSAIDQIQIWLLDPERALRFLSVAARDPAEELRVGAVRLVNRIRSDNVDGPVDLLTQSLADPSLSVRESVVAALAMFPTSDVVRSALERAARDSVESVRRPAAADLERRRANR